MISLDLRSNIDQVAKDFAADIDNIPTATYRALNRALDASGTDSNRQIRKRYNLRQRVIAAAMEKIRANKNRLWAVLRVQGAKIPLIEFDARWRPGQPVGATVRILVGGSRKPVAGAFIARVKGGKQHVLQRVGHQRLPIRALTAISIPQAFNHKTVIDPVQAQAIEAFEKNFEQQLIYLRGRNGG